jgi:hypothetical protein
MRAVGLLLALLAVPAVGGQKKLTLLYTGENGGEVAPCG